MRIEATPAWKGNGVELFLLEESHVTEAYVAWLENPVVNRYLESRFTSHTLDSVRDFVRQNLQSATSLFCGIRSAAVDGAHVGNIKLAPIDLRHGLGEVGIMIGEERAWGKGIGAESIRIMMRIARGQLGLRKLTAGCYESNLASQKSFERAGFTVIGRRPKHFLLDGRPEDLILMDCLLRD